MAEELSQQAVALWFIGFCCLIGEVNTDFVFYETLESLCRKLELISPYRNPN